MAVGFILVQDAEPQDEQRAFHISQKQGISAELDRVGGRGEGRV